MWDFPLKKYSLDAIISNLNILKTSISFYWLDYSSAFYKFSENISETSDNSHFCTFTHKREQDIIST